MLYRRVYRLSRIRDNPTVAFQNAGEIGEPFTLFGSFYYVSVFCMTVITGEVLWVGTGEVELLGVLGLF